MHTRPANLKMLIEMETHDKPGLCDGGLLRPRRIGMGFSSLFFKTAGVYLQKHTSFMLKCTVNNVIASISSIIIVVVIIIASAGGGA